MESRSEAIRRILSCQPDFRTFGPDQILWMSPSQKKDGGGTQHFVCTFLHVPRSLRGPRRPPIPRLPRDVTPERAPPRMQVTRRFGIPLLHGRPRIRSGSGGRASCASGGELGPLTERTCPGRPRRAQASLKTSRTSSARMLRTASRSWRPNDPVQCNRDAEHPPADLDHRPPRSRRCG